MRSLLHATCILSILAFVFTGCHFGPFHVVDGNGNVVDEERHVGMFRSVEARGFMNVYVTQGDGYHVRLQGESNILPYIETKVGDNTLVVGTLHAVSINTTQELNVYVTVPQLDKVVLSGSGNIISKNTLSSPEPMHFDLNGSGDVNVAVDAPAVSTSLAGSGRLRLSGQTRDLRVELAGSGTFRGDSLKSEAAKISIMGSGNAYVFASVHLDVSIGGSGDVYYWGGPSISSKIFGSGNLKKQD